MNKKLLLTILLPTVFLQAMQENQSSSSTSSCSRNTTEIVQIHAETEKAIFENGRNLFSIIRQRISQDATQEQKTALEALAFLQFMPKEIQQLINQSEDNCKPMRELTGHTEYLTSVAIDGDVIVTASGDQSFRVYNRQTGELIRQHNEDFWIDLVAVHDDIIITGGRKVNPRIYNILRIYNKYTGKFIRELTNLGGFLDSLAIDEDVIVTAYNNTVSVHNRQTGEYMYTLEGHTNIVLAVAVNCNKIVTGCSDRIVRIFNKQTGELITELTGHSEMVRCVAIDNAIIVTGGHDGMVRVYDTTTAKFLRQLEGNEIIVTSIAIGTIDGNRIIVTGSKNWPVDYRPPTKIIINVYDSQTGACIQQFPGHTNQRLPLAIDGDRLVVGSTPRNARIYEIFSVQECLETMALCIADFNEDTSLSPIFYYYCSLL